MGTSLRLLFCYISLQVYLHSSTMKFCLLYLFSIVQSLEMQYPSLFSWYIFLAIQGVYTHLLIAILEQRMSLFIQDKDQAFVAVQKPLRADAAYLSTPHYCCSLSLSYLTISLCWVLLAHSALTHLTTSTKWGLSDHVSTIIVFLYKEASNIPRWHSEEANLGW